MYIHINVHSAIIISGYKKCTHTTILKILFKIAFGSSSSSTDVMQEDDWRSVIFKYIKYCIILLYQYIILIYKTVIYTVFMAIKYDFVICDSLSQSFFPVILNICICSM